MFTDNREDDGEKKEKDRGREGEPESAVKNENNKESEGQRRIYHTQAADRP